MGSASEEKDFADTSTLPDRLLTVAADLLYAEACFKTLKGKGASARATHVSNVKDCMDEKFWYCSVKMGLVRDAIMKGVPAKIEVAPQAEPAQTAVDPAAASIDGTNASGNGG